VPAGRFLVPVGALDALDALCRALDALSRRFYWLLVYPWRIEGKTPWRAVSVRLNAMREIDAFFALKSLCLSLTREIDA